MIEDLRKDGNFMEIDPSQSTIRLIESAKYVICFPFTSVALQADEMGKKVAYYDPVSWVDKNDPASNGIPLIQGKAKLLEWMENA
jgi:polysaccharide biosynthesis PFTS motif protein